MRNLCILTTTALLMTACGGGSGGGGPASATSVPLLLTPGAVEGMVASNEDAEYPTISGDGQFVAFQDESGNAVLGDTNEEDDLLLHEVATGTTALISRSPTGILGDLDSDRPAFDTDGSHLAFESQATNLVAGDTNGEEDIFLHNRMTGVTTRVSVHTDGTEAVGGRSGDPVLSGDGAIVAFESSATNLVTGDSNGQEDIFVHDTATGTTTRVNVATDGSQAVGGSSTEAHISADGNLVVFESGATNLVANDANGERDIFLHNRAMGTTIRVSVDTLGGDADGDSDDPRISADGTVIVFHSSATDLIASDTNGSTDVFAYVVATGVITRVSVGPGGAEATGGRSLIADVSAGGRYVSFESDAADLVTGDTNGERDIFRHDRTTGTTIRVNVTAAGVQAVSGSDAEDAAISNDGMRIVWDQSDCGLVPDGRVVRGNDNVFMKDLGTGDLTLISTAADRSLADGPVDNFALSSNGAWLAFDSRATNLVPEDTNNRGDLFLRDMTTGAIARIWESPDTGTETYTYQDINVSDDGRFVCFESDNPLLLGAGNDTNGAIDIFVVDTLNETIERANVHTDGTEGNSGAFNPAMSADGRYVLFLTAATSLITGDVTGNGELLLRDRTAGTTTRAVTDKDGAVIEENIIFGDMSADGRYIAFGTSADDIVTAGDIDAQLDLFRHDRTTGTNVMVSLDATGAQLADEAFGTEMSGDGTVILFVSASPNFVPNDTNGQVDAFAHDVKTGLTSRINVDSAGNESTAPFGENYPVGISMDGNVVAFRTYASDLTSDVLSGTFLRLYAHNRTTGVTVLAGRGADGGPARNDAEAQRRCMGPDGSTVVYAAAFARVISLLQMDITQLAD